MHGQPPEAPAPPAEAAPSSRATKPSKSQEQPAACSKAPRKAATAAVQKMEVEDLSMLEDSDEEVGTKPAPPMQQSAGTSLAKRKVRCVVELQMANRTCVPFHVLGFKFKGWFVRAVHFVRHGCNPSVYLHLNGICV